MATFIDPTKTDLSKTGLSDWPSAGEVIQLDRYPLHDLESEKGRALVHACREQIAKDGAVELKEFLTPFGLAELVKEGEAMESTAFHNTLVGNAYLDEPQASLPADHVRRMTEPTSLGAIAYDQFPKTSLLRKIFEWDPVMLFVGAVLELPQIHRYADPMGALNLSVMKNQDYLRWHFDQTDFVTSLAVRSSEAGGKFEYAPLIRGYDRENYEAVRSVLNGSRELVHEIANAPGTLVLFKGRNSLHRVTPIEGKTSRLMALFGFDSKEGVNSSDHLRRIRYGRVTPLAVS